jgi:hypothetical protein
MEPAQSPLIAWETFFLLIGSSAAALTGLQFVVIALIAESKRRATHREIEAFTTPTIVHFGGVLLVSAIVSAPWYGLSRVALILGGCGLAGVAYTVIVVVRARRLTTYQVVFADWLWHVALPLVAYALLVLSAVLLPTYARQVLFVIGATALLLLFIGIHNAWDTVTYITVDLPSGPAEPATLDKPEDRADDSPPPHVTSVSPNNQTPDRPKHGTKFRAKRGKK